jgi:phospholipase/carboxylesterase
MTQELATRIVRGEQAERLLVLVHGLGTDENDLAELVPHLDPGGRFLAVLPRGPFAHPPGFAWFPIGPMGARDRDPNAFVAALDLLDAALDREAATHGMAREDAVVAGFSQGAAMAAALAYRAGTDARPRPAGVIAMSGFLLETDAVPLAAGDDLPPALVQHGLYDPMVPAHRGRKLAHMLAARGAPVVYKEYPMQHQVVLESIDDARDWLAAVLAGERPTTENLRQ